MRGTSDYTRKKSIPKYDRQYILSLKDTTKLKILIQYAFADSPTFNGLTEVERAILGDTETYDRLISWACEDKTNPYSAVPCHDPYTHTHAGEEETDGHHQHEEPAIIDYIEENEELTSEETQEAADARREEIENR